MNSSVDTVETEMKQQKIEKNQSSAKKHTVVIDDRTPKIQQDQGYDPQFANMPVRMINYVEVGDMAPNQMQFMIQELNKTYNSAKGGLHYFVPVRHGKIGTDIEFEQEWLETVRKTCEVNENGEIVLKDGAKEVHVVRQSI